MHQFPYTVLLLGGRGRGRRVFLYSSSLHYKKFHNNNHYSSHWSFCFLFLLFFWHKMGGSMLLVLTKEEGEERVKELDRGVGGLLAEAHIVLTRGSAPSSLTLHIAPYDGDVNFEEGGEGIKTRMGTRGGERPLLPTIDQLLSHLDSLPLASYGVAVCRVPKIVHLLQRHIPIVVYEDSAWSGEAHTESPVQPPEHTSKQTYHLFLPLTGELAVKVRWAPSPSMGVFHWDWRQRELLLWLRDRATLVEEEKGGVPLRTFLTEGLPSFMYSSITLRLRRTGKEGAEADFKSKSTISLGGTHNHGRAYRVIKFVTTSDDPTGPALVYGIVNGGESDEISLVEPAFTELFLKYHYKRRHDIKSRVIPSVRTPPLKRTLSTGGTVVSDSSIAPPAWADPTISLSQWTPPSLETVPPSLSSSARTSYSQPPPQSVRCASVSASASATSLKMHNKNMLKKLMLLSLRHVGIDKHHEEFASIWKHLYCACLFALRKELAAVRIQQNELFAVIRSNMNFLNIK